MRSNEAKIKKSLTEMRSNVGALTARVIEADERVSDTED